MHEMSDYIFWKNLKSIFSLSSAESALGVFSGLDMLGKNSRFLPRETTFITSCLCSYTSGPF